MVLQLERQPGFGLEQQGLALQWKAKRKHAPHGDVPCASRPWYFSAVRLLGARLQQRRQSSGRTAAVLVTARAESRALAQAGARTVAVQALT